MSSISLFHLISGFLELFSKAIDETWFRARPRNAFYAYNENFILLLDVVENLELSIIPPALLESIAYNLDRVSHYVGRDNGQSIAAYNTWKSRRSSIPQATKTELENIAQARNYIRLKLLLKSIH
jgi:hypothetical protein